MAINTTYINQDNASFLMETEDFYVDKTNLIAFTNHVINKRDRLMCVSRPRRFGKSLAAKMLNAYYSKGCSSKEIFDKFKIANDPDKTKHYEQYLNKYDVIYLDIQKIYGSYSDYEDNYQLSFVKYIQQIVLDELENLFKEYDVINRKFGLVDNLSFINNALVNKFIFIIDEWNFIFRDLNYDNKLQTEYIN